MYKNSIKTETLYSEKEDPGLLGRSYGLLSRGSAWGVS